MKSVWPIKPPEKWEKKFGKHPTQKTTVLLERILQAATNQGDTILDPFSGSGTTILASLKLCRTAIGLELSKEYLHLSLQRLTNELVQVALSLTTIHFSLDPVPDPMDRSKCSGGSSDPFFSECSGRLPRRALSRGGAETDTDTDKMAPQFQLVHQESRYYFIGRQNRNVIFSTLAPTLEAAIQNFRNSGHPDSAALFIIKTETTIFLA